MHVEDMAAAIGRAHGAALDEVTRALWASVAAGECCDEDATKLSEAIQARRTLGNAAQAVAGRGSLPVRIAPPRKHQRPPDRTKALERSRRWAAAGRMPPAIACKFTSGEQAALAVIAVEVTKRNACSMAIAAVAAIAGVSASTVKRAIRQARALGLLTVQERRVSRYRNDTNIVRVINKAWLSWLELRGCRGGVQPGTRTSIPSSRKASKRSAELLKKLPGRQSDTQKPEASGARVGGARREVHRPSA